VHVRAAIVPTVPILGLLALELIVGSGLAVLANVLGLSGLSVVMWCALIVVVVITSTLLLSHVVINEHGIQVRLGVWSSVLIPAGHVVGADAVSAREGFGAQAHGADLVINGVRAGQRWPFLRVHCDAAYPARIRIWRRTYVSSLAVSVSPEAWERVIAASSALAVSKRQNP